jgi:hypothetical protein
MRGPDYPEKGSITEFLLDGAGGQPCTLYTDPGRIKVPEAARGLAQGR